MSKKKTFARRQVLTCFPKSFKFMWILLCLLSLSNYPLTPIFGGQTKEVPLQAHQLPKGRAVPPQARFYAVTSHPSDSFKLYSATATGLQVSENGGLSWHAVPINGNHDEIFALALHPAKPEVLYAGRRDGLWKSKDGGLTWNSSPYPDSVPLAIDVAHSQLDTLYVGTARSGVFKSTDGGEQWTEVNRGLPQARAGGRPEEIRTLVVDPTDSNVVYTAFSQIGIYRTVDGGASWHEFNKGIPIARPISPPQLSFDREDPRRLFLGFSERIHSRSIRTRLYQLSDNDGWIPLRARFPANLVLFAMIIDGSRNVAQLWGAENVWEVPLSSRGK